MPSNAIRGRLLRDNVFSVISTHGKRVFDTMESSSGLARLGVSLVRASACWLAPLVSGLEPYGETLVADLDERVSSAFNRLHGGRDEWTTDAAADYVFAFLEAALEQWHESLHNTSTRVASFEEFVVGLGARFNVLWDERLRAPASEFFHKALQRSPQLPITSNEIAVFLIELGDDWRHTILDIMKERLDLPVAAVSKTLMDIFVNHGTQISPIEFLLLVREKAGLAWQERWNVSVLRLYEQFKKSAVEDLRLMSERLERARTRVREISSFATSSFQKCKNGSGLVMEEATDLLFSAMDRVLPREPSASCKQSFLQEVACRISAPLRRFHILASKVASTPLHAAEGIVSTTRELTSLTFNLALELLELSMDAASKLGEILMGFVRNNLLHPLKWCGDLKDIILREVMVWVEIGLTELVHFVAIIYQIQFVLRRDPVQQWPQLVYNNALPKFKAVFDAVVDGTQSLYAMMGSFGNSLKNIVQLRTNEDGSTSISIQFVSLQS